MVQTQSATPLKEKMRKKTTAKGKGKATVPVAKAKRKLVESEDSDFQDEIPDPKKQKTTLEASASSPKKKVPAKTVKKILKSDVIEISSRQQDLKLYSPYFEVEQYFTTRINHNVGADVISNIKSNLSDPQLSFFSDTCFGKFLKMKRYDLQCNLIHGLLLREVKQPCPYEMWVNVCGKILKFGLEEFVLVTGLNCTGESDKGKYSDLHSDLKAKYFTGLNKISKKSVEECFLLKRWDSDENAVKLAVLYFIELFLYNNKSERLVLNATFYLVDSGLFEQFAWGKDLFDCTIEFLKNRFKAMKSARSFKGLTDFH
ncbi:uncharacterized protein LOC126681955 [Mercurialis annua]|uniref:uncharacterized protein LOC126681955 n=1 Tax=Mercurialis annua TaxID=3986 RepID=UPI00215FEB99|nr:uncharacterized protein LOC126681955 [Mercurialis annua]